MWREIENDIDRVFMNGKSLVNSAQGVASLRRLLRAYSIHNQGIGYCQGMNFVAGLLLEVRCNERNPSLDARAIHKSRGSPTGKAD